MKRFNPRWFIARAEYECRPVVAYLLLLMAILPVGGYVNRPITEARRKFLVRHGLWWLLPIIAGGATTYYVRKTGSDANNGTNPSTQAWLTIGKALGNAGASRGDTVYVGAGTYRETVATNYAGAAGTLTIIGDWDGVQTGDAGEIVWTAYTTDDKTAPGAILLNMNTNTKSFLSIQRMKLVSGTGVMITMGSQHDLTVDSCSLMGYPNVALFSHTTTFATASNITINNCVVDATGNVMTLTATSGTGADYQTSISYTNNVCDLNGAIFNITKGGASANLAGGGVIRNNYIRSGSSAVVTAAGSWSTTTPMVFNNNIYKGASGAPLNAGTSGHITEDWNVFISSAGLTNVTAGTHSVGVGHTSAQNYAPMFRDATWDIMRGSPVVWPHGTPYTTGLLRFGNDGSQPANDMMGVPRPATALCAVGPIDATNNFGLETGTVRTGSNAISVTGPGYQDFEVDVDAVATTMTVWVRWDATYAGTKPQFAVRYGTECGVTDATATAAGSSGSWEQLSLTFTPTRAGVVTLRVISSDTNGGGKMFVDDFAVS